MKIHERSMKHLFVYTHLYCFCTLMNETKRRYWTRSDTEKWKKIFRTREAQSLFIEFFREALESYSLCSCDYHEKISRLLLVSEKKILSCYSRNVRTYLVCIFYPIYSRVFMENTLHSIFSQIILENLIHIFMIHWEMISSSPSHTCLRMNQNSLTKMHQSSAFPLFLTLKVRWKDDLPLRVNPAWSWYRYCFMVLPWDPSILVHLNPWVYGLIV